MNAIHTQIRPPYDRANTDEYRFVNDLFFLRLVGCNASGKSVTRQNILQISDDPSLYACDEQSRDDRLSDRGRFDSVQMVTDGVCIAFHRFGAAPQTTHGKENHIYADRIMGQRCSSPIGEFIFEVEINLELDLSTAQFVGRLHYRLYKEVNGVKEEITDLEAYSNGIHGGPILEQVLQGFMQFQESSVLVNFIGTRIHTPLLKNVQKAA